MSKVSSRQSDQIVAFSILAAIAVAVVWSYLTGGLVSVLLDAELGSADTVDALRDFFTSWGALAPLVYVLVVVVEAVIAPIPGAMLYLPGGVIFGGFWGGTLSLIGNVVGAGACCLLMRTIVGREWSEHFFTEGRLSSLKSFILRHGVASIALLRVNPLTSSDIVSYAAGLTPLSTSTVMAGTLIGMAPLCYVQAYMSMELFSLFPWLIWPFVVACVIYAVVAGVAIHRLRLPGAERAN